jgi:hypothetical protein
VRKVLEGLTRLKSKADTRLLDFGLMVKYSDTFRKGHIVLPVIFGISIDTPFPAWSVLENLK